MGFNDPKAAKFGKKQRGIVGASMPTRRPGDPRHSRSESPLLNDRMLGEGLRLDNDGKIAADFSLVERRTNFRVPDLTVFFHSNFGEIGTDTTPPNSLRFLDNSVRHIVFADLSPFTQVLFFLQRGAQPGATNSYIEVYYAASFSSTVGNYAPIGSAPVRILTAPINTYPDTGWIDIVPESRAKVYLALVTNLGDGVASPTYGTIGAHFRR